jgi:hypothetical protein
MKDGVGIKMMQLDSIVEEKTIEKNQKSGGLILARRSIERELSHELLHMAFYHQWRGATG